MVGSAEVSNIPAWEARLTLPQDDVLFFSGDPHGTSPPSDDNSGNGVPAKTLVALQPRASSGTQSGRFGPELSFGRTMADALPNDSIALIKHAHGGSKLSTDWNTTTGFVYAAFKETVAEGLAALRAAGHDPEIAGMMWMQGESDVWDDLRRLNYEADLTHFIVEIRSEYRDDLPFVIGQVSIHQTAKRLRAEPDRVQHLQEIKDAQANVASTLSHVGLISTDDFPLREDELHFNAEGLIAMGQAMAQAYLTLVPEPSTALLALLGR